MTNEHGGGGAGTRALRWTRTDQIGLEGLLWAVPALPLADLGLSTARAVRDEPLEVAGALPDVVVRPADGVVGPVHGAVALPDPTVGQHLLALVPDLLVVLLVAAAAGLLLGIARGLRRGDPFTRDNARRLTQLALLVGVGGMAVQFVAGIANGSLLEAALPDGPGAVLAFDLALWPVPVGLLIAFLAEVFSRGTRLREDVDGLV